jgi:hypothetical protein
MPAMRREGRESFIEVRVRERLPDVCLMSQWPVVQIDEMACKAATKRPPCSLANIVDY